MMVSGLRTCWLGLAVICSGVFAQYEDDRFQGAAPVDGFSDSSCRQCLEKRELTACAVCLAKYDLSMYGSETNNRGDTRVQGQVVQYISCQCCVSGGDPACCATCRADTITNGVITSEKRGINPNPAVPYFTGGSGTSRYSVFGKRSVPSWVTPYFIYGGKRGSGFNPIPPFVDSKRSPDEFQQDKRGMRNNRYRGRCTCCDWDRYNFKCCLACSSRYLR